MKQATRFTVQQSWRLLITDMGLNPLAALALAKLPTDLFTRKEASLTPAEYFTLWQALETLAGAEALPLKLGQAMSAEGFDPAIFSCLCSPDLNTALTRLAQYKRLVGPLHMTVQIAPLRTTVTLECYGHTGELPRSLAAAELVFFTRLARLATRRRVVPKTVRLPRLPGNLAPYEAWFGCALRESKSIEIAFDAADAAAPFLTENATMWTFFEAGLRERLAALDAQASISARVRAVLLEMLPAGRSAIGEVARRLAISKRTLQRQLREESVGYQTVLSEVRQALARHYLMSSTLSPGEIAWLLGFQESNSFTRAFRLWTGLTPVAYRERVTDDAARRH